MGYSNLNPETDYERIKKAIYKDFFITTWITSGNDLNDIAGYFYTHTSYENKKKGQLDTIQLTFLNICYN